METVLRVSSTYMKYCKYGKSVYADISQKNNFCFMVLFINTALNKDLNKRSQSF